MRSLALRPSTRNGRSGPHVAGLAGGGGGGAAMQDSVAKAIASANNPRARLTTPERSNIAFTDPSL